jgi:hypothetical protein
MLPPRKRPRSLYQEGLGFLELLGAGDDRLERGN